jgi:ankyrin repeat protein
MQTIRADDALAVEVVQAIQTGDLPALETLLRERPELARTWIAELDCDDARSLLHIATDWPGQFPNGPAVVAALVGAGADVNAKFVGAHSETPLHWAASSDDVDVLDALIDTGADLEAPGAVLGGGTAMADAVGFGQWKAAGRLLERGATTTLWQAAALGLLERVEEHVREGGATPDEFTHAFWQACHGGQRETAQYLLDRGADLNWVGWNDRTPLDIAAAQSDDEMVAWLRSRGARSARELR